MDDLVGHDATGLAQLIAARQVTASEVVQAHLERIEGSAVNAFVTVLGEQALRAAANPRPGPLSGVPFTIKDSFDTAGVRTTRGSLLFASHVPAADATAVARMRAAGAIPLGKTNLPEMSYWTETDNRVAGLTRNPWDLTRTPGGSSGGESAAIASGQSPLGLGSDVAISVRGPAHDTGIASIKPTYGRVPCTGHFPDALRRWWHVGPMARSVRDLRLALSILEGPDGVDVNAVEVPDDASPLARVGWTTGAFGPIDPEVAAVVAAAADALTDLGVRTEPVELPWLAAADHTRTSAVLMTAEIAPYLRGIVRDRVAEVHPVIARTLRSPEISAASIEGAERAVSDLRASFGAWFEAYDVLLCPVITMPAPEHGQQRYVIDGVDVAARNVMRATVPFNFTGLPAVALPFGTTASGLPVGVQLVGRHWSDRALLDLAEQLESVSLVRGRRP
jgi:aspartyl-tRNA(Asn)/glutamyl-tRNA(Gln) amidotransferase subunit A